MSMYKGPYVFEFIGAFVRWSLLMLFSEKERKKKNLFKEILAGDSSLAERSSGIFIFNFSIGLIVVVSVTLILIYIFVR